MLLKARESNETFTLVSRSLEANKYEINYSIQDQIVLFISYFFNLILKITLLCYSVEGMIINDML